MFHPSPDWIPEDFAMIAMTKVRPLYDEAMRFVKDPHRAYKIVAAKFSHEPFHEEE